MNLTLLLRSAAIVSLVVTALAAQAADTYSNLAAAPNAYYGGSAGTIGNTSAYGDLSRGWQFTAAVSGQLSGFEVAINNDGASAPVAFTLDIYGDNGSDELGNLLGLYRGMSSGLNWVGETEALDAVTATGSLVSISSASRYWIVASTSGTLLWNTAADRTLDEKQYIDGLYGNGGGYIVHGGPPGAFSVQVNPVLEPATLAALGLSIVGLTRKRQSSTK